MKILSITAQKPHSTGSGVYLTQLVRAWDAMGCQQAVVAGLAPGDQTHFPAGVALFPVRYETADLPFPVMGMSDEMPYPSTRYRDLSPEMVQQLSHAFRQAVQQAVEALDPDLVVCHHLYLLTALVRQWLPERRVVGVCHGSDLRQLGKNPLARDLIRETIPRLDGIFALHQQQRQEILRLFPCPAERVRIAGAGYDPTIFFPASEPRTVPGKHLIFAGKVTEKKGVFSLLRALEQLPYPREALQVTLAGGHGPQAEFDAIRALAAASPYPVALPGPLPQTQLATLLREGDVFVLPSFFEGLPLVNLEAMACGCRVVCTDLPGIAQWYDRNLPGHGTFFVPPPPMGNLDEPDPQALPAFEARLAAALVQALDAPRTPAPDLSPLSWGAVARRIAGE